jgi:hypothetical protein
MAGSGDSADVFQFGLLVPFGTVTDCPVKELVEQT